MLDLVIGLVTHRIFRQYVTFFFEEVGDTSYYEYMNGRGTLEDSKTTEVNLIF